MVWLAIDEKPALPALDQSGAWQQMRLIEFEDKLSDRSHLAVGALGEVWASKVLQQAGYDVSTVGHQHRRGDLLAISRTTGETWQVEVKTARRGKDGCWRWNLVKDDRHGHTDVNDADVLLLLAVEASGSPVVFVVPVAAVAGKQTVGIRGNARTYAGYLAAYRQTGTIRLEAL